MKAALVLLLGAALHIVNGQIYNLTVDQYVSQIDALEANSINYTYPVNSYSYLDTDDDIDGCGGDETYDFIICGAGSTGSVLANRLSEITKWKILLLDAGSWENAITDIPGVVDYLRTTHYNWGYHVTPQTFKFGGYLDHSITIPRGKALGGSSVINAMIYARGNKADFDKWASLGNPGWSYGDVLPYFKKSENAAFPNASSEYHGEGGDLNVEYSRIFDKLGQAFLDAQEKDLGRKILDYNGKDQMGFSIIQMNEIFGRRDSGGKAFINRARNRTNLHIVPNALITKILIHKANKKAYGVRYVKNGRIYFARANKEVILSAGVFNSPQLLMLSGIGPRWHLEHLGIQTVHDLPNVGENLWDHLIVNTQAFSINYTYVNPNETVQVEQYLDAKGSLTSPDNVQCIGYVSLLDGTDTVPDVEHVFHTSNPGSQPYEVYKNLHRYTRETYENIVKPTDGISQWSIHSVLLHPKSRGNVRLNSKSPYDFPLIDPKYFSSDSDVETLIRAIKDIIRIAETPSMQKYNSTIIKVSLPVCRVYPYGTDDFWRCMVINLADTVHHFGGTCKMGPADDQSSVVGPDLKVHGIQNLRVADCSVIPVSLSGHTNAPAYMIGEKASDIIKQHYGVLEKNKSSSSESSSSSSSESSSSERE